MSQRRSRPPYNQPPRRSGSNSPVALVSASVFLLVVVAIVGWIVFGMDTDSDDNGNGDDVAGATATVTATAAAGMTATSETGQPASTVTVTETATETGTESADVTTPTAEPEATATAEPTAEPTPAPEPTPTPVVGDFGELPSAEMPSGSSVPRPLDFDFRLDMSLQQIPTEAAAYQLLPREWSEDEVANLASQLGLTGEVTARGAGSFQVTGNGELYISGNLVQVITAAEAAAGEALPDDAQAIEIARAWLLEHQLTGANTGAGTVIARNDDAGRVLVRMKPLDPDMILAAIPSASVTIGPGGTVIEANVRWPGAFVQSVYGLRDAESLWQDASNGLGYIEVDGDLLPEGQGAVVGEVVVTGTDVAYTTAGSPETQQFLVPLVVFLGQATIEGSAQTVPVSIYVPAAGAEAGPRG